MSQQDPFSPEPEDQNDRSDNKKRSGRGNKGSGSNEPGFNWRALILISIATSLVLSAFFMGGGNKSHDTLPFDEFAGKVKAGQILDTEEHPLKMTKDPSSGEEYLSGSYTQGELNIPFKTVVNVDYQKEDLRALLAGGGEGGYPALTPEFNTKSNMMASFLISFLPLILILGLLYFFFRQQMKMAGKGAMSFGKSKAKMMNMEKNKVTFKDVVGVE